jgi:hypothetical protein
MRLSDSGTDLDSNFELPGSLTDTTDSAEPPYDRRRTFDAVDHFRATRQEIYTLLPSIIGLDFFLLFQHTRHCCTEC